MAFTNWKPRAKKVAQVQTATPQAAYTSATFTITCNTKAVSYVSDGAATLAIVCAGLKAAWDAAALLFPEIAEITMTDGATLVTLTGPIGVPFTVTVNAKLVLATTTAAAGPNYVNDTNNWTNGVPTVGIDTVLADSDVSLLYGLDQIGVDALASFQQYSTFSGAVGLPRYNPLGYYEYRPDYLDLNPTLVKLGIGEGYGSGRMKLNFGTNAVGVEAYASGNPLDTSGIAPIQLKGSNAANTLEALRAQVDIAMFGGETAQYATISNNFGTVRCGVGVTLATLNNSGSLLEVRTNFATLNQYAGKTRILLAAAVSAAINHKSGTIEHLSSGTIASLVLGGRQEQAFFDAAGDLSACVITSLTLHENAKIRDPNKRLTISATAYGSNAVEIQTA